MKVEWDHVCRLISACTEQGLHRPGGDQLPHPLGLTLVPREASTWSHSLLVTWPQALLSVCVCVCVCVCVYRLAGPHPFALQTQAHEGL